jgi:hypothetical protein
LILEWQKAEFFLARQEPLLGVGRSQRSGHANRSELVVSWCPPCAGQNLRGVVNESFKR